MTQPDLAITDAVVSMIDTNWGQDPGSAAPTKPDVIDNRQDVGKGTDVGNFDYVMVSPTTPTGITYADLFMKTQDVDAAVFIEIATSVDRARRDEIFDEVRYIVENRRNRQAPEGDPPNNFERIEFSGDITKADGDIFGAYTVNFALGFVATSRHVNDSS